jgi:hypothetical protein
MKIGTILKAINRNAAIYVCLAVFFALCWFFHQMAFLRMEGSHRQFIVMNDRTLHAMALIDWVAANLWLAIAYIVLVVAAVIFAQVRGHPAWTYWLTAVILSIPYVLYCGKCVYIMLKFRILF